MVSYVDIVCLLMTKYPHLTIILPPVTLHFNNVTLYEKPSKNVNVYTSAARCLFRASVPKLYRMSYEGSVTQLSVLSRQSLARQDDTSIHVTHQRQDFTFYSTGKHRLCVAFLFVCCCSFKLYIKVKKCLGIRNEICIEPSIHVSVEWELDLKH